MAWPPWTKRHVERVTTLRFRSSITVRHSCPCVALHDRIGLRTHTRTHTRTHSYTLTPCHSPPTENDYWNYTVDDNRGAGPKSCSRANDRRLGLPGGYPVDLWLADDGKDEGWVCAAKIVFKLDQSADKSPLKSCLNCTHMRPNVLSAPHSGTIARPKHVHRTMALRILPPLTPTVMAVTGQ